MKGFNTVARMTAKYTQALKTALQLGFKGQERDRVYDFLLSSGYNWDGKTQTWDENNKWMGSAFEDFQGNPTGHFKLRLMAHPNEIHEIIEILQESLADQATTLTVTSDKVYDNRNGVGVRVYLEGTIK